MKREIKFRAWDGEEMFYFDLDSRIKYILSDLFEKGWVMQYTGMKDLAGIEIYEGDILNEHLEKEDGSIFEYPVVQFKDGMFTDDVGDEPLRDIIAYHGGKTQINVIGNIYENPNLLKK